VFRHHFFLSAKQWGSWFGVMMLGSCIFSGIAISDETLSAPSASPPSTVPVLPPLGQPLPASDLAQLNAAAKAAVLQSPLRSSTVVDIHHVALNTGLVSLIINSTPSMVPTLPFTVSANKPPINIVTTDLKQDKPDSVTWIGRVVGDSRSSVIFIVNRQTNLLSGEIRTGGIIYEVTPSKAIPGMPPPPNVIKIIAVDPRLFPKEHGPGGVRELHLESAPVVAETGVLPVINVMVLYSPEAVTWLAAYNIDIAAQVCIAIDRLQEHFNDSGIQATANLVHYGQVEITENPNLETFLLNTLLIRGTSAGDPIYMWRNQYAADIVSFWVSQGNNSCGQSYVLFPPDVNKESSAFSVVVAGCATENNSFVHEAGHLFGANHNRYAEFQINPNVMKNSNANFGYIRPDKSWKTVMAYDNDACPSQPVTDITGQIHIINYCERLRYWSDPSQIYGGDSMGQPDTTTLGSNCTASLCQGPADNTGTLQSSLPTVSKFRPRSTDPAGTVGNTSCVMNTPPAAPTGLKVQ